MRSPHGIGRVDVVLFRGGHASAGQTTKIFNVRGEERVVFVRAISTTLAVSLARRILCLLSLLFAGGFYFFIELLDNYLANGEWRGNFILDLLLLFTFFILAVGAAIGTVVGLLCRQKRLTVCSFLFVACACLSFWFRRDLIFLGDRIFLSLNERSFGSEIRAAGGETAAVILQGQSWGNVYQLFVYSGSRSLPDGRLSLDEIDALGGVLDELRGCKVSATHLKDHFYILNVDCR